MDIQEITKIYATYGSLDGWMTRHAERHLRRGVMWLIQGRLDYAMGSFSKAARWDRRASDLMMGL